MVHEMRLTGGENYVAPKDHKSWVLGPGSYKMWVWVTANSKLQEGEQPQLGSGWFRHRLSGSCCFWIPLDIAEQLLQVCLRLKRSPGFTPQHSLDRTPFFRTPRPTTPTHFGLKCLNFSAISCPFFARFAITAMAAFCVGGGGGGAAAAGDWDVIYTVGPRHLATLHVKRTIIGSRSTKDFDIDVTGCDIWERG